MSVTTWYWFGIQIWTATRKVLFSDESTVGHSASGDGHKEGFAERKNLGWLVQDQSAWGFVETLSKVGAKRHCVSGQVFNWYLVMDGHFLYFHLSRSWMCYTVWTFQGLICFAVVSWLVVGWLWFFCIEPLWSCCLPQLLKFSTAGLRYTSKTLGTQWPFQPWLLFDKKARLHKVKSTEKMTQPSHWVMRGVWKALQLFNFCRLIDQGRLLWKWW